MVLKSVLGDYASLAMIGIALVAILANSTSIDPDDSIPWEVTLCGTCALSVSAVAILAKKPEVAYFVMGTLTLIAPSYYVWYASPLNPAEPALRVPSEPALRVPSEPALRVPPEPYDC
jgi:hypothetical protein